MEIKRSEVYFCPNDGKNHDDEFRDSKLQYITCGLRDLSIVYKKVGTDLHGVCRVLNLIDDRNKETNRDA